MPTDIHAYQELFSAFQPSLQSYLFRLLANRKDAEDLTQDTFIKSFEQLSTFKGASSLKTWVFQIATNLALNYLKRKKRWTEDVCEKAKQLVLNNQELRNEIVSVQQASAFGKFEMKEHIDTSFTCIGKNLPIENQVAVLLRLIYDFSIPEICLILSKTAGVVKYLIQDGRKTMIAIFDQRCALINKNGVCNQCSELNGWFNPKQNKQEALMKLDLYKGSTKFNRGAAL
jgi:RNA polymerase sigma-70 factor (ECF subfamily)